MTMQHQPGDLVVNAPQAEAFAMLTSALARVGSAATWSQAPTSARFNHKYMNFWRTGVLGAAMHGQLDVIPLGDTQSAGRITLTLNWGGMKAYLALLVVGAIMIFVGTMNWLETTGYSLNPPGMMLIAVMVIGMFAAIFFNFSRFPKFAHEELIRKLTPNLAPAPYPVPAMVQPVAAPVAPPPAAPDPTPLDVPAPAGDTVFDKIKKLGDLRDAGLITDADFDAQKTELLKRL